ncbi:XRE family transcriptional regulator [Treponema sp. TIM-1]|uniref:XRE family transcriptional regulator n=1 Tax=Treponema sp. TIM-1 TaxID=2898417 RepID=UPI00397FBDA5
MRYKSEIFEVIHQEAAANFEIGAISAARMREYDEMCLVQESKPAKEAPEITEIQPINSAPAGV